MARPLKQGLDFFNIDCTLEDSVLFIKAKHGLQGFGVVVELWRKIYRLEGYYCHWNEKSAYLFAQENGIGVEELSRVVESCLSENIFCRDLLDREGILTSGGIQKRFLRVVHDAKRRDSGINPRFLICTPKKGFTPEKPGFTPEETPKSEGFPPSKLAEKAKSAEESTQSKVKESKVNTGAKAPVGSAPTEGAPVSLYKSMDKTKKSIVGFIRQERPTYLEPYFDLWNIFVEEIGARLPAMKEITPSRRKAFAVRIREKSFDFEEILRKAKASQVILASSWFSFDWLLKNDKNYLKVLEGNYDKPPSAEGKAAPAAAVTTAPKGFEADLRYLVERFSEPDFDSRIISPDIYDLMVTRNLLPVNYLQKHPGGTIEEQKIAAVAYWLNQNHLKNLEIYGSH